MNYLLDTNVISEARKKAPDDRVAAWLRRSDPGELYLSVLSLGEIVKGAEIVARRDPAMARSLRRWLDGLREHYADRVIAFDGRIAEEWGRLSALRTLAVIDALIAATASVHGMTLVTRNVRDVAGIGVATVDPWNS